ncbi:MAG: polyhydroxyalkanoate granule-associated phasin, partial [Burkholderiales bacterium]
MARKRRRVPGSLLKAAELAIAAPQVVAIRTARMLAAGPNPNARDRAEFSKMGTEKVQAFWESMFAMGRQVAKTNQEYTSQAVRQLMGVWTNPWWLTA